MTFLPGPLPGAILLQVSPSPWTFEASTRERWWFGAF